MSIEKVRDYFRPLGREGDILEFPVSSATVELAAQAAGVIPARIAKTLSFLVDGGCVLIVAAGDAKIDNPKYKAMFHTKAKMLTPEQAQEMTGHAVGGVCPFANPEGVKTYLDVSLKRFDTVFPAAGSSNSAIELTLDELERFSGARDLEASGVLRTHLHAGRAPKEFLAAGPWDADIAIELFPYFSPDLAQTLRDLGVPEAPERRAT